MRGIHWSPVNSPHKVQWRGALISLSSAPWINGGVSNREAGDLRRHRAHYDVIVMVYVLTPNIRDMCLNDSSHRDMGGIASGEFVATHSKAPLKFMAQITNSNWLRPEVIGTLYYTDYLFRWSVPIFSWYDFNTAIYIQLNNDTRLLSYHQIYSKEMFLFRIIPVLSDRDPYMVFASIR